MNPSRLLLQGQKVISTWLQIANAKIAPSNIIPACAGRWRDSSATRHSFPGHHEDKKLSCTGLVLCFCLQSAFTAAEMIHKRKQEGYTCSSSALRTKKRESSNLHACTKAQLCLEMLGGNCCPLEVATLRNRLVCEAISTKISAKELPSFFTCPWSLQFLSVEFVCGEGMGKGA